MRRFRSPLSVLACVTLLVSQLSGLHMHVDSNGYTGSPQYAHVHDHARGNGGFDHDPGHESERDVSVVKLSGSATKVLVYFAWLCLGLFVFSKRLRSI